VVIRAIRVTGLDTNFTNGETESWRDGILGLTGFRDVVARMKVEQSRDNAGQNNDEASATQGR